MRTAVHAALAALALATPGRATFFEDPTLSSAFPLDTATLQQVATSDLDAHLLGAAALGSSKNCTVECNGEEYEGSLAKGNSSHKGVDCWGTFKVFCKASCSKACAVGAYKCEGHFVGFEAPCGAKIGVCAGAAKKFGKAFIRGNETAVKVFKAGGGIGVSGGAVAAPNVSLPASVAWPASLSEVQGLAELYEGQAKGHALSLDSKGPYTLKKAFGDGAGGGVAGIKKLSSDDLAKWEAKHADLHRDREWTFEKLEEKAERKLKKLGYPVLPVAPSYFDLRYQDLAARGGCELTCNGKPAWLHGNFPCFGSFKVECLFEVGEGAELGRPLPAAHGEEDTAVVVKAGCKGFYSGFFGHKCKGFSYSKTYVKGIAKYGYCSGKAGKFFKKRGEAVVKGGSCFGKGLYAVQYTPGSKAVVAA